MLDLRKANTRGHTRFDWLESRHGFSFGSHYDPTNLGFRSLRVVNEDWIAAGTGFGAHPHRDMEILTYVLDGEITHRDGEGNGSTLEHGRVQLMSAGRGIVHSEVNSSADRELHLLQIWIEPEQRGLAPNYQESAFTLTPGQLEPLATPRGEGGGLSIRQSAAVHALQLTPGQSFDYAIPEGRHVWVQIARGAASLGGSAVEAGDAVALSSEQSLQIQSDEGLEALVFDLA